jgi:hypothetical protein
VKVDRITSMMDDLLKGDSFMSDSPTMEFAYRVFT